jgi:hypothetical protein
VDTVLDAEVLLRRLLQLGRERHSRDG